MRAINLGGGGGLVHSRVYFRVWRLIGTDSKFRKRCCSQRPRLTEAPAHARSLFIAHVHGLRYRVRVPGIGSGYRVRYGGARHYITITH